MRCRTYGDEGVGLASPAWPGSPFGHPAWLEAHLSVLEPDLRVEQRLGGDGVPIATVVGPDQTVRLLGDRMSDVLRPTVEGLVAVVGHALASGLDVRLGPVPLPVAAEVVDRHRALRLDEVTPCPEVRFGGRGWAAYLDGPAARRRRRIAADAERALEGPALEVVEARTPDEVGVAAPALIDLHRQRFGGRSQSFEAPKDEFLATALRAMSVDGIVCIRTLVHDGRPAAAILCFETAGAWWYYQAGWDPELAERSVGRTLFADTVRAACERGLDLRLLRGDEEYKTWWATHDAPVATVVGSW